MMKSSLPKGWRIVKFGDVVDNVNETTKDPESIGLDRVVGLDHMDPESLPLKRWDNFSDLHEGTSFTRVFRAGQVLFGKRRAYQRKVSLPDFDGICSGDILVFQPRNSELLPEFLPYLVQSDGFFDHALGTSAGSLSPRTKWQELAKYEFALPPITEQSRIVSLISLIDAAINAYQSADFTTQIKSIIEDFELSAGAGWRESTLGEIAEFINGYPFKPADLGTSGTPVIRIKQLLDPNEKVDKTLTKVAEKYLLKNGDIVFSWSATLAVRLWDRGTAVLNQHLFRVVEKPGVLHEWLPIILNNAIEELFQKSHGTTMKHITKQSLLPHKVILPPIEEQSRLVGLIEQVNLLESKCEESISHLFSLRSSFINDLSSSALRHV